MMVEDTARNNIINRIKSLEKQLNNKKLPQYKRNQAKSKLYDIETKWHSHSKMVWNSVNGPLVRNKICI